MPGPGPPEKGALPPRVTTERTVNKFNATATNISGTALNLRQALSSIETELKEELKGKQEYEAYLTKVQRQKAELQKRIDTNRQWIAAYEQNDTSGDVEAKYKQLLSEVATIYAGAKEHHSRGIDMLVKNMEYHPAFKRWSDTFSTSPFKPK